MLEGVEQAAGTLLAIRVHRTFSNCGAFSMENDSFAQQSLLVEMLTFHQNKKEKNEVLWFGLS